MLEAIDIILVCLGAVLSIFILLAIFLAFATRHLRKPKQLKPVPAAGKVAVTKEFYLEQQPSIGATLKNGAVPPAFVSAPKTDVLVRVDDVADKENRDEKSSEKVVVLKVEELSHVRRNEEVHRAAHSIKRPHRPCKIKLSPDIAKAAHAEAVQTEHTVDNFMGDLSRIRNGGDAVLYEEFQILEAWDTAREKKFTAAESFRRRNRFADILPNDDTRVILRGPNDYINASLIDLYSAAVCRPGHRCSGQFIATQGPIGPEELGDGRKDNTVGDFWRMIWEKNVQCVLMLTDCVESMRIANNLHLFESTDSIAFQQRCSKYWPSLGEAQRYGDLEVDLVSESEDPICTHRELDQRCSKYWPSLGEAQRYGDLEVDLVSESEDPICTHRELDVSQYHFLNWHDAKGPESTGHLLDFLERVMHRQFRKPIVVHCSAGVGRTGVLIALWRLLERARRERTIDIFGTVDALRRQRSRMVQTPEQYLSLYEAISLAIIEDRI
ncbi:unnamed protein product [Nippostrongylus brasiliensis]|uniref:FI18312p1 (inferred by orthology to a D. melanogaster protein) n=1 Tax=Nippostrongylus brasiliensis TaxID=27835 RepID=A0A158R2C9_NIPBR|nr:unnamed protein product [Nippostrongylus brasiliensis]